MAKTRKLKVYRTAIGFHDAYVAAPSQKAALAAWGSDKNLFARGAAEPVDDPALTTAPLAAPGTVIKRLRGTPAEQIAALPADTLKHRARPAASADDTKRVRPPGKRHRPGAEETPRPAPSRQALDDASRALDAAEQAHDAQRRGLQERAAALAQERRMLEKAGETEQRRLRRARDEAATAYEAAMRRWRG